MNGGRKCNIKKIENICNDHMVNQMESQLDENEALISRETKRIKLTH